MTRVLALAAVLLLALACLTDVAHAACGEADGCAEAKLENPRSPVSFVDSAVLPDRFDPGERATLARIVHPDSSITAPSVLARRSAPRAPPIA